VSTPVSMKDLPLAKKRQVMSEWISRLQKAYGRPAEPTVRPPLDHLIYEHLVDELGRRQAGTAMDILQREFVDWNEVRVSRDNELAKALTDVGLTTEQSARLRRVLSALFERTNSMSLEELKGKTQHEIDSVLGVLAVSKRAAATTAFLTLGANVLAMPPEALRVLQRLAVMGEEATADEALEELANVVAAADRADFYWLFGQHAARTCKARGPLCPDCVVLSHCPTGQARTARKKTMRKTKAGSRTTRRKMAKKTG